MRTVTNDYLAQVQSSARQFDFKVKVYGNSADGDEIPLADIISIDIVRSISDQLQTGACMSAKLTLQTKATTLFGGRLKKVEVYCRCKSPVTAWEQLGTFYVDESVTKSGVTAVKAYDKTARLDKKTSWIDTGKAQAPTFPCKMQAVLNYLCARAGMTTDFVCEDITITNAPDGYTARELISYIAASHGANAYVAPNEVLKIVPYAQVNKTVGRDRCYAMDISGGDYTVKGILFDRGGDNKIYIDGTASEYDEDTDGVVSAYNPFATVGIAEYAWNKLGGLNYSAASLEMPAENILEVGDVFTVKEADGTEKKAIVMEQSLSVSGSGGFVERISCSAESKAQTRDANNRSEKIEKTAYVSLPITNPAAINYDAIERGLLSVDFTVSGTDSAVVFAGAQQCNAASAGTVDIAYKVDGATQDHKPSQALTAGKHILPHYLAMALSKGKHNFAVYITSADGRGSTPINGLAAALSGQISGIKINTPPNDNLLLYFGGVPAGTTITLPNIFSTSTANKSVDWGDGTAAETTKANASVEHTYAYGGDYVVTMQSTDTRFLTNSGEDSSYTNYLTGVYFPDSAQYISVNRVFGNCPNLETIYLGKSATYVALILTNCAKLTSLIFPDTAVGIGVTLTGTSVTDIIIPAVATTARAFNNLTSLQSIAFEGALLCSCQSDTSLKTVRMTDKINAIPDVCFSNCTSLADIDLPKTITKIGANAFSRCAKLPSLPLLPELTSVGARAFEGCSGLSDAAFGDKLASMGIYAFHNCVSLSSVDIPSSLVTLPEGAFQTCTGLTSVSHGGLMTIGAKAFEGCTQLTGFEFPAGLIVGSQAFAKTGFESVDVLSFMPLLTSGTTAYGGKYNIGAQAFANCTKLSEVSGYKYKFSVGLRVTESTKEDGVWTTTETDMGEMADARGIYNAMGATSDSVFSGTALKTAADYLKLHPEYSNESTSDYKRTYTAYDIKPTV